MSVLHNMMVWLLGHPHQPSHPDVHPAVRDAVHQSNNSAQAALSQPVLAERASQKVYRSADRAERIAHEAIATIEAARGDKPCGD